MADAARLADDAAGSVRETWRRLNIEQRVAGIAALLLVISTFGPFSFVEVAEVLTGVAVLALLRQRANRKAFHLPLGDGTAIMAAGLWAGLLIVVRLFDRPLGQSVLALACATVLAAAGLRERAKRPPDDLPPPRREAPRPSEPDDWTAAPGARRRPPPPPDAAPTVRIRSDETVRIRPEDDVTTRLPADPLPDELLPDDPPDFEEPGS